MRIVSYTMIVTDDSGRLTTITWPEATSPTSPPLSASACSLPPVGMMNEGLDPTSPPPDPDTK